MLISVIVPTNRMGGLDVLFEGLSRQEHRDFELVLVDEVYSYRYRIVKERSELYRFHVTHLPPKDAPERFGNYMLSMNTALSVARGEVLLFLPDYCSPDPECLLQHALYHQCSGHLEVRMASQAHYRLPPVSRDFPRRYGFYQMGYDPETRDPEAYKPWLDHKTRHAYYERWAADYQRDLDSGALSRFGWSVFEDPPAPEDAPYYHETHGQLATGRMGHVYFNLKNCSMRADLARAIGFDERADGCHGHQDSIFAKRVERAGGEFLFSPFRNGHVKVYDPHGLMVIRRMRRPDTDNHALYEAT